MRILLLYFGFHYLVVSRPDPILYPPLLYSTPDLEKVDDEQLVYLQNLVLVSNEAVTAAFGVYEEDKDLVRLAESLKQVCLVFAFVVKARFHG